MRTVAWRLIGLLLLLGGLLSAAAQTPPTTPVVPSLTPTPTPPPAPPREEKNRPRLPSGTIVIVTDRPTEALQKGDAVYLSGEKFRELLEQNEQLRKQLQVAEKAPPPSECRLEARLETRGAVTVVRLRATLRFKTLTPRSAVALGFQNAQPLEPKLDDGRLPVLLKTDQGLSILVETEGEHTLRMELETPLISRGSKGTEAGFELGLPGAPITLLTAALPPRVRRLTMLRKEVGALLPETRTFSVEQLKPDGEGLPLGALSSVELTWEDAESPPQEQPRAAIGDTQLTITDGELQAECRLRLNGSAREWRLAAPHNAEVSVRRAPPANDPQGKGGELPFEQAPTIVRPEPNQPPLWKLQFREPNAGDLAVLITARQPRPQPGDPRAKGPFAVGPFAALDVASQQGTIRVKSPPQLRLTPLLKGDTRRQDSGDDPLADAVFRYTQLPPGPNNLPAAPLELELRTLPGVLQTSTTHSVQPVERGWRLTTEIQVTPIRLEVDRLELELPSLADLLEPRFGPAAVIEGVTPLREVSPQRRVIQVRLVSGQRGPFTLAVEGVYPVTADARQANFHLPRVLNASERDSRVYAIPAEGQELRAAAQVWLEDNKPGTWNYPLKAEETRLGLALSRMLPARLELAWRPAVPRFRFESLADLFLLEGSHRVQQQFKCVFTGRPPRRLELRLSEMPLLRSGVAISPGSLEWVGDDRWVWTLPADAPAELTARSSFAFREEDWQKNSTLRVPLLWAESAEQSESKVRVWRDPSATIPSVPVNPSEGWRERPPEVLPDEKTLPMRVYASYERFAPLSVEWQADPAGAVRFPVQAWAERTLIQVQVLDNAQRTRLRVALKSWTGRKIDLELPPGASDLELFLAGKRVEWVEGNRVVPIPLPAPTGEPLLLEVRYHSGAGSAWLGRLQPPNFRGTLSTGTVRWQVALPPRVTPLCLSEGVLFEERWALRGGLPVAVAGRSAGELESWVTTGVERRGGDATPWELGEASLAFRQAELEGVRLLILPRLLWLALVSLAALLLGLGLSRLSRGGAWLAVAALLALGLAGFFLFPQLVRQALAAALPGGLAAAVVVLLQRWLQHRYRWRVAHMPAFRAAAESSLGRGSGNGSRPQPQAPALKREPSTIDAPPAG